MTFDVDAWVGGYKPPTQSVRISNRGDLVDEIQRLEELLPPPSGSLAPSPEHREIANRIAELEDELERTKVEFTFTAPAAKAWADLLRKHPPSKQDQAEGYDFNPETFPPAAVALCSHEPKLTVEQAQAIRETLPHTQWLILWGTVSMAVHGGMDPKASRAEAILRASKQSAGTASSTESPDPSTSASLAGQ